MALSLSIKKVIVASVFEANAKVADVVASGGTPPYSYSLVKGDEYFQISGTEVLVKEEMNSDNLKSFGVKVTDSESSEIILTRIYPDIIQRKFKKSSVTYRIVTDYDLYGGVLSIPYLCVLDFQGGKISNGTVVLNRTKVFPMGCNISDYITATIQNQYAEGQVLYDPDLKKMKLWNGTSWVNLDGTALE